MTDTIAMDVANTPGRTVSLKVGSPQKLVAISALDTLKDADVCNDNCSLCNEARAALDQSK